MRRTELSLWLGGVCLALALSACLAPMGAVYFAELQAQPVGEGYKKDPVDGSVAFSKEGLQVSVRYLNDDELAVQIPGADNPYLESAVDPRLGYRPKAFTVFQVTVNNPTYAKVRLDPEKVLLVTDRGLQLQSYGINRSDVRGGMHNFETYFLARGVQTGNAQKRFLEQMGKVRETVYHRDSPVFKGKSYTGKIVFAALPPETKQAELRFEDFVVSFGIHDEPVDRISLRFPFAVAQGVRDTLAERR